jgi:hypothetical protein
VEIEIFTENKLTAAIRSFKPYNSRREDGIFLVLLQKFIKNLISPLIKILRENSAWEYIPKS